MRIFSARFLLAVCAALALAGPLHAQGTRPRAAPPAPAAPAPPPAATPEPPPPPYEPQLLRLSEIMGALAFLRDLCGDKDGTDWNARMGALIEAEAKTEARREKLAGAYNRGFRSYEVVYRACTPAANLIISRYLDEGGRIARDISSRFGG